MGTLWGDAVIRPMVLNPDINLFILSILGNGLAAKLLLSWLGALQMLRTVSRQPQKTRYFVV